MRSLLILTLIGIALPFVLFKPQLGVYVWTWISFMNPHRLTWGAAYDFPFLDLLFPLVVLSIILNGEFKRYQNHIIISAIIVYLCWVSLTTYYAFSYHLSSEKWIKFLKIFLLMFFTYVAINNKIRFITFMKILVLCIGFYGIKGGIFTLVGGGVSHVLGPPESFFADNNHLALVMVMTLPMMIYFWFYGENRYIKAFSGLTAILTAIAILGTQSRGGFIALIVASLYFILHQRKIIKTLIFFVPIALVASFVMSSNWSERMITISEYEEDSSFEGRVQMWEVSKAIARDHPIMGGGFDAIYSTHVAMNYIPPDIRVRATHSHYYEVLSEHGYVGLTLFLGLIVLAFIIGRRVARKCKNHESLKWAADLSVLLRMSLVGYTVHGLAINGAIFDMFYTILIMFAILENQIDKELSAQKITDADAKKKKPIPRLVKPR